MTEDHGVPGSTPGTSIECNMGKIEIKQIKLKDSLVRKCADIIQEHSWGLKYPIDAWSELKNAEYILAAFSGKKLIGGASITRVASPDGIDNGKLWFADAVVLPDYRGKGIYRLFYKKRFKYIQKYNEPVFSCTDNPFIEKFLLKNEWILYRTTMDEGGGMCKVFVINDKEKHL